MILYVISVLKRKELVKTIPNKPNRCADIIKGKRITRIVLPIRYIGAVNELRAESATMIISTLLVRLASTDACPITIPPTIPTVKPTLVGKRAPASLSNSIVISKKVLQLMEEKVLYFSI